MSASSSIKNYFVLILAFLCLQGSEIYAQNSKTDIKLGLYLRDKAFDKVIKFKQNKPEKLSAYSLYLKGLAYYMTKDDRNAAKHFSLAIEKGPATDDMYYYHGITMLYQERYKLAATSLRNAVKLLDSDPDYQVALAQAYYYLDQPDSTLKVLKQAIKLHDCPDQAHFLMAYSYLSLKDTSSALQVFKTKMNDYLPGGNEYGECSYNIGLFEYLAGNFDDSRTRFKEHLEYYPNDYASKAKLIQCYYALNQTEKAIPHKKDLYDARNSPEMPTHMKGMFCFDQFVLNQRRFTVFEYYEEDYNPEEHAKIGFFHNQTNGDEKIDIKVFAQQDTVSKDRSYLVKMNRNDTLYTFGKDRFKLEKADDYYDLRAFVQKVLEDSVEATEKLGDYEAYLDKLRLKALGDSDGSSYAKAIKVGSVSEEYDWLATYYPGHKFLGQALTFQEGNPFDVLTIEFEGKTKKVYFDVSSFFGKTF